MTWVFGSSPNMTLLRQGFVVQARSPEGNYDIKKPPFGGLDFWWPWSDSNRHSSQNLILSQARLPIPPQGHGCTAETVLGSLFCINFFYQAGTAVWFVCRLFGRGFCFADFLFNGFFNSSHFFG